MQYKFCVAYCEWYNFIMQIFFWCFSLGNLGDIFFGKCLITFLDVFIYEKSKTVKRKPQRWPLALLCSKNLGRANSITSNLHICVLINEAETELYEIMPNCITCLALKKIMIIRTVLSNALNLDTNIIEEFYFSSARKTFIKPKKRLNHNVERRCDLHLERPDG